jgi:hypothetical protein
MRRPFVLTGFGRLCYSVYAVVLGMVTVACFWAGASVLRTTDIQERVERGMLLLAAPALAWFTIYLITEMMRGEPRVIVEDAGFHHSGLCSNLYCPWSNVKSFRRASDGSASSIAVEFIERSSRFRTRLVIDCNGLDPDSRALLGEFEAACPGRRKD